jgi:Sulfotransferase domain
LTTRENSNVWFASWQKLTSSINPPAQQQRGSWFFTSCETLSNYFAWLYSHINQDTYFLNKPYPFPSQNKQHAIASYEAHNARVREKIPKNRLLEFSVTDGWEPLCQFLCVTKEACPTNMPFPRGNSI